MNNIATRCYAELLKGREANYGLPNTYNMEVIFPSLLTKNI